MTADHPPREFSPTPVRVPCGDHWLHGDLGVPPSARGMVVFAHGSGSSRHSPRNKYVARVLDQAGFGTLLIDLLTTEEEVMDERTARLRFDINLLAGRLVGIVGWIRHDVMLLPIGLFGASTGAAAALVTAAERPHEIAAIVSRGGRPDLAETALSCVPAPTLLIVGSLDTAVIQMNRDAMAQMPGEVVLDIVPGATHLFEEPGALERVAVLARDWFERHLPPRHGAAGA